MTSRPEPVRGRSFWRDFLHVLPIRPRQALDALYWFLRGRKVRARNRLRLSVAQPSDAYATWIEAVERQDATVAAAPAAIARWIDPPLFSIVLFEADVADVTQFRQIISSLDGQCYSRWEMVVVPSVIPRGLADAIVPGDPAFRIARDAAGDAAQALAIAAAEAQGDFLIPLPEGALLPPAALYRYAEALQDDPGADVLYGDHDRIDAQGFRCRAWFKPQWNAEMALAQDYFSQACAIRTAAARCVLPVASDLAEVAVYALLLELTERQFDPAQPVHVPHVLAHLPHDTEDNAGQAWRLVAVARAIGARGHVAPGPFGTLRVQWPLPAVLPLVSIIVPTRDHVALLRACIDGVLKRTVYGPIEILVVDNGSTDPATLAYLQQLASHPDIRVLRYDHPYNYAAINNFAAAQARGEYLCLLNNDTEVIAPEWLAQMMRQAVRPHVGAVGAMLLYDDGSIQHAGVVVGLKGAAGHAHRFARPEQPGYFCYPHVAHYLSAVTAACLVVERRKYDAVGGLDAQNLAIAFNDVDLCLKLRQAGWRTVYTPQAVMVHHESKSRGKDVSLRHVERYRRELAALQRRWGAADYTDPLHHPQLDPESETFAIRLEKGS